MPVVKATSAPHVSQTCIQSVAWVVTHSGGNATRQTVWQSVRLVVGDRIALTAASGCKLSLGATPLRSGVLSGLSAGPQLTAVAPGLVLVFVYYAMCDGNPDPQCRGGIASMGEQPVEVVSAA
jgi:hypothetical protein